MKKFKVADYWHIEIFVAIPFLLLWTFLLFVIAYG